MVISSFACACALLCGCTPSVGDRCTLSTDCSIQGSRICDTSQPNGYCTVLSCTANSCPDNAACVEFGASLPGCPYSDYSAPSRTGRAMCMKKCGSSSDCRQSEGYACIPIDSKQTPWTVVLDTVRASAVCMISGMSPVDATAQQTQVCSWDRPDAPPIEASQTLEPTREAGEGSVDGPTADAMNDGASGADALEEGTDAPAEGSDAQDETTDAAQSSDAGGDASGDVQVDQTVMTPDSGAVDAPAGS
jgi:hypothetical protein